jgi:hypothetical protein
MWTLALEEINNKPDWKNRMLSENGKDPFLGSARIIRQYLNTYYPTEWSFAQFFNYDEIQDWIRIFCNENYVAVLNIREVLECKNYEDLLNEKYSEKAVSKEAKERTERLKNIFNELYKNAEIGSNEWYIIHNALDDYTARTDKDLNRLHNMINTKLEW